ncbi:MAG: tetratricopeptide repeat protein [Geminicoccaceae bacterium]|nr:tetratricopeptide repeat protein [Geminicoccaceae bacterium]
MRSDMRGLELGTGSGEAVAAFDEAVQHFLEYRADTGGLIERAIEADPAFLMPRILRAGALLLMGTNTVRPMIDAELAAIDALETPRNPREELHERALLAWARGDLRQASRHWETIIARWPLDILALRSLHFQNFWMGAAPYMRQVVGATVQHWDESTPGYGFVLGMLAFGFEECGEYRRAEHCGREAVERNGDDMWAIHAVAHVLEMQGRTDEGRSWLAHPHDHWNDRGPFKAHLWWHRALFAIENGAFDEVLDLYDAHIRPGERFVSTDMMNAPSLLARLEFQGVDVGDRWERLAERSTGWIDDHVIAFTDAHTMFPLARTGRTAEAEAYVESLERLQTQPSSYVAEMTGPYLLPVARATKAYYEGDFRACVDLLMPLRAALQPIGGSWAQRDLFHQLLLEAAIRAGDWPNARLLAQERIAARADNGLNWNKLATILDAAGEKQAAENARQRATTLAA